MAMKMVKSWLVKLRKIQKYRRTVHELERLTNRDLADLGIARCDIERIARQSIDKRYAH
jgi:uncharacterized protein YjiS (DUF1127 family)